MSATSATTLVTFLVRTPPNVRSVKLLGSWDNFSREYGMERDSRIGRDHWRGCHTFTNIICDGRVKGAPIRGRDGALKMGGTYWYHYRLDDDIDFYNEAEPSTTSCPFLPGQPVNVLNVPVHLPSVERYHCRAGSTGSQTSTHQTMNPEDKYTNPRPPPRPKLPPLMTSSGTPFTREALTSPVSTSPNRPGHARSLSHPREAQPRRKFRAGGKLTLDLKATESQPVKNNPIRTAFLNFASPRFAGKGSERDRTQRGDGASRLDSGPVGSRKEMDNRYLCVDSVPQSAGRCSNCSSPLRSPMDMPSRENLGSPSEAPHMKGNALGLAHRRDNSIPRPKVPPEPPNPTYNPIVPPTQPANKGSNYSEDVRSIDGSERGADRFTITCKLDLEKDEAPALVDLTSKRLPTLPNSPSSVLDEELSNNNYGPDLDALRSHFSESTTQSPGSTPDMAENPGGSHFSAFTTYTDAASPDSMTSASTLNNDSETEELHSHPTKQPISTDGRTRASQSATTEQTAAGHESNPYQNRVTGHDEPERPSSRNYDRSLKVSGLYITKQCGTDAQLRSRGTHSPLGNDLSQSSSPIHMIPPYHNVAPPFSSPNGKYDYQTQKPSSALPTPRVGHADGIPANWRQKENQDGQSMMQDLIEEMNYLANSIRSDSAEGY